MAKYLEFQNNNGLLIEIVELNKEDNGRNQVGNITKTIIKVNENFENILKAGIEPVIKSINNSILSIKPDNIEVKFGLSIAGEANFLIPKISSEASFEITLKWGKSE